MSDIRNYGRWVSQTPPQKPEPPTLVIVKPTVMDWVAWWCLMLSVPIGVASLIAITVSRCSQ